MAKADAHGPSTTTVVRITLTVVGVLLALSAAWAIRSILTLVVVALFLAAGLDPAVRRLERMGLKRGQAVLAIFLGMLLFIVAFLFTVVPPLVKQVTNFASDLPGYVQDIAENNPKIQRFVEENNIAEGLQNATKDVPKVIGNSFGGVLGVAGSVVATLFNGLTVMVLTIYFLLSFSHLREGSLRLVPKSRRDRFNKLMDPIIEKIGGYIAGQISVALLAGALAYIFLVIAGVPFPVALALWVSIAALIPLVGATLGAVPAVIVAFFHGTTVGVVTLIYFLAYQQIENYIIHPRIMTKAVDVSPAAVLLAALIGASLLGFVGALMAIPVAASLKLIAQEVVLPRMETT